MENEACNSKLVFCVQDEGKQVRAQKILRMMAGIFNKREGDFPSLKEYNDYLEDIMDMTTNLIEGRDVGAIEEKIRKYENENATLIQLRRKQKYEEVHGPNEGPSVSTESNVENVEQRPRGVTSTRP